MLQKLDKFGFCAIFTTSTLVLCVWLIIQGICVACLKKLEPYMIQGGLYVTIKIALTTVWSALLMCYCHTNGKCFNPADKVDILMFFTFFSSSRVLYDGLIFEEPASVNAVQWLLVKSLPQLLTSICKFMANQHIIYECHRENLTGYLHPKLAKPGGSGSLFGYFPSLHTLMTYTTCIVTSVTAFTTFCGLLPSRSLT